ATFGELIQSGKVGHVGTSNFCGFACFGDLLSPLLAMAEKDTRYPRIEVEQPRYNLLNRAEYEDQLQSIAVSTGLGIVTYSSLASGFLSGAFRPGIEPVGERASQLRQYFTPSGWSLIETLDAIGARHEVPLASVALAWALAQPGVTSTIIGPDSIAQLAEASYAPAVKLDEGEISALNERSWDASAPEFVDW
ncbi:MAG: aldo/keto reductase, partial [Terrimesophilobacter sp.]